MKHCTYCGKEYSDDVEVCPIDGKPLRVVGQAQTPEPPPNDVQRSQVISPAEQSFWERMTFRQFGVLMIRLQAVWLLFYAALDLTYLPAYIRRSNEAGSYPALSSAMKVELLLAILRVIAHVAAAVALIQYAERVLSWLVKDLVPKEPPRQDEKDTT